MLDSEIVAFVKAKFDTHKCYDSDMKAFLIPKRGTYVFKKADGWHFDYFFEAHLLFDVEEVYNDAYKQVFESIMASIKEKNSDLKTKPTLSSTVPTDDTYQVIVKSPYKYGDMLDLYTYYIKSIEVIRPKWYQFWKPVIEKHYIVGASK